MSASSRIGRVAVVAAGLALTAGISGAQSTGNVAPSSVCWRFAFNAWNPPLNWEGAGHAGKADELAERVRRVRDSVYVKDSSASRNNAMVWEQTTRGWSVVLFPSWWPVGLKVEFDSVLAEGREMTGQALAFVADAGSEPSRARAKAVRCPA